MRTCAHACNSILAFISVMYHDVFFFLFRFFLSRTRAHFLTTITIRHFLHRFLFRITEKLFCFFFHTDTCPKDQFLGHGCYYWMLIKCERECVCVDGITLFFSTNRYSFLSLSLSLYRILLLV